MGTQSARKFFLTGTGLLASVFTVFAETAGSIVSLPVGEYARSVDSLTWLLLIIGAVFFVITIGLAVIFIIRFRAGKQTGDGAPIHGNTKLEIFWTAVPAIIMVVLGFLSINLVYAQYQPPKDSLVVKVIGYQFDWDFAYYKTEPNGTGETVETVPFICGNPAVFVKVRSLGVKTTHTLKLPQGVPVRFLVTAKDVLHSWWVPEFRIKRDAVPNYVADVWTVPDKVGVYAGKCAELCGTDHGLMIAKVEVVPKAEFDSWLSEQQNLAAAKAPSKSE